MSKHHERKILTSFGQQAIFERISHLLPDMSWRRGESEQEGALRVSGQHPQGAWVEFWLYDDDAANVFTMISPSEADPGLVISATWFDDFVARLDKEVLPQLGEVSVTPEPTPHADAPPPKNRTIASASTCLLYTSDAADE